MTEQERDSAVSSHQPGGPKWEARVGTLTPQGVSGVLSIPLFGIPVHNHKKIHSTIRFKS